MNKPELIKEVIVVAYKFGKYLYQKHKEKKERKKVDDNHGFG